MNNNGIATPAFARSFDDFNVLAGNPGAGMPYIPESVASGMGGLSVGDQSSWINPNMPKIGGGFLGSNDGGGFWGGANGAQKIGAMLNGLGTIGNLWGSFKALSLANKQFEFQKKFSNANLANQIQSYNTTLADRSRSRAVVEGQSPDQAANYVSSNSLKYTPIN